ncbi:MAG: Asp-tRNA(Asn)/Glu-tRNA(Gln) amidotransferase subunit GatC [Deltaproteobacteria bacterium]|jgi:aspartyl-tRNA(Asn)/glutamyl-tRNA(Gln) amidotransferase subunit C|nr:Asp-tRNA(Asn)/Glu-tRNA(Gln) amidotransferase subunit GatC [Deltaproteobacteria bacterium]
MLDEKSAKAVAELARLELVDSDSHSRGNIVDDFVKIVGYMDILAHAQTEGVDPLYCPIIEAQPPRADEPKSRPGLADKILEEAPERVGRFFAVPRIV